MTAKTISLAWYVEERSLLRLAVYLRAWGAPGVRRLLNRVGWSPGRRGERGPSSTSAAAGQTAGTSAVEAAEAGYTRKSSVTYLR